MLYYYKGFFGFIIFVKKTMAAYHKLKIKNIKILTSEASTIGFEVPSSLKDPFQFQSGQYIGLKTIIEGKEVRRSYSLCSAPFESLLEVGIKRIPNGLFSTHATQELKVGDSLEVAEPEGRFVYDSNAKNVTAFAAGSGITPVFSILKTALNSDKNNHFTLVYGNKTPEQTLFYNELKALEAEHPSQLKILWLFSQSNEKEGRFGRIDSSIVKYALKNTGQLSTAFYLCGPEPMILEVKNTLLDNDISEHAIYFELFSASIENPTEKVNSSADLTTIEIIADDSSYTIKSNSSNTILDAALNKKIDVPYSCQGGVCCSCIAKITEGSAAMASNQVLTDEEVADGLVLTCQAVPSSSKVVVNYDDV
jgi:ring-1,2-phenylacetyl-CoA epoxidase subunit PaaE